MGGEQDERKMYYRKTRKGKVFNVVRERYLRDDVGLGTLVGQAMIRDEAQLAGVLGEEHMLESGVREILVLDTNVVLKQIDVLEKDDCAPFHNVVLCDTVLGEVKKINLGIYNRVLLLLRDDKRCFIAFPNENHRDTWSVQRKGESPNDYNDRLIRDVTKWYRNQVEPAGIAKVKLLTNDRKCKELAIKEGLSAETIHAFVDSISSKYPELSDLLAQPTEDYDQREQAAGSRVAKFAAHLSEPEITRRLQAGTVTQGTFRVSPYNRKEGSIMVYSRDGTGKKILIRGFASMNRAMEGDRVAVSLVSRKEANLAAKVTSGEADDNEVPEATDGLLDVEAVDPESATLVGTKAPTVVDTPSGYGVVVGIIKRAWREYCASVDELDATREVQSENVLVVPVDQKIPKIRIRTRQLDAIKDKRILVSIDSWDRYSNFPDGHFIRTLGVIGDRETETAVLLHEHDIPTRAFSKKVMKCLPREGADWTVTEENSKGRVDLRHLPICSIDPPGCKDIDDALHFRMLENGNIEVGVHIADVTHFVRAGTPIDQEAANRGTSTYLVERRLDMLPGLLTTDICSLRGEVERFAFSVIWEFTPPVMDESRDRAGVGSKKQKTDGSKMSDGENNDGRGLRQVNVRFCKSIIKSKAAMSYGEAQVFLDDPTAMGELPNSVRMLNKVAKVLRQRRIDAGALTLASPEVRFKLDNDSHDPTDVEMYQHKETNALVEEFMLLANITVAKRIVERFPRCSMLRRHPKPDKEMFQELLKATRIAGVELQVDTSKELADSLDLATKPGVPFFNKLIRILTTRCMMQAVYFTSGEYSPSEYGHYGLASSIYTHFTSPIRRYADVIVHRLLAAAEGIDPLPESYEGKEGMKELSDNLNRRHHMAQLAGRASIALHTVVFFRNRTTDTIAMVSRVRGRGVVVVIPEYGIEGKINFTKTDEQAQIEFDYDEDEMSLVHKETKLKVSIFDQVKVRLFVETRTGYRQNLVVSLLDPPIPMVSASISGNKPEKEPTIVENGKAEPEKKKKRKRSSRKK